VVFYDSNTTLDERIDISELTAPTTDDTGIQATRNMWFDFSALPLQRMTSSADPVLGREPTTDTTGNDVCYINDLSITIKRDTAHPSVHRQQGNAAPIDSPCVVVSISFVPNVKATHLNETITTVADSTEFFVKEGVSSTLYSKDGTIPLADNSYDVALGCYTWEQIYSTPHALLSTQNATNGANAATFGTLIYDKDSMKKHRQNAYTQIFRKIYGDLFGLNIKTEANPSNVYYEIVDDVEVHTFEMYVCIKDDGSGTAPIDSVSGYHDVEWYVTEGDSSTATYGKKITTEVGESVDSSQIAGRFWRDMIIEHADLSGNIDFGHVSNAGEGDVFQFVMTEETRDNDQNPVFATPTTAATTYSKMMQKNFSSMLVNVLNHHNVNEATSVKRNWTMLTGPTTSSSKESMFGPTATLGGISTPAVGHKLVTTRFQTNHHHKATGKINLQFEQNLSTEVTGGDFTNTDPGSFGELVEVNIPIKSSNYGNNGIDNDAYTLFLRANLDLTFDVDGNGTSETGNVFYGQKTGKITELMFGIFVKPIDSTDINAMYDAAIRAKDAYETTKMERNVIHGYNEEIQGHLDRFTELTNELDDTDVSFKNMVDVVLTDFTLAKDKLVLNKSNLAVHYANVTEDVSDAANYSNDVDAAYSTTVANAKAALAEQAATDAQAEQIAALNEMRFTTDPAEDNAKLTTVALIDVMEKMEIALVLGGDENVSGAAYVARINDTAAASADAFFYAHTVLTANINNCDEMTTTIAGWKTSIDTKTSTNSTTGGSVLNYDDELNVIESKTAELATLKGELEAIRTELDAIGGEDGSLRGNGAGNTWTHNVSMFSDPVTYADIEAEFEKMDQLIEARDLLLARRDTANDKINAAKINIYDVLKLGALETAIENKGDSILCDPVIDFTSIAFV